MQVIDPYGEQKICVSCGFCCDGTLFLHASLNEDERGSLPEKIEAKCFIEDGKNYFHLPCDYFRGKCTIYNQKKADVCSAYRCQLLYDFSDGKISLEKAIEIVKTATEIRTTLVKEYNELSGNTLPLTFKEIQKNLYKERKANSDRSSLESEILQARCNIFEALLIRHIRAEKDFEKMIIPGQPEINNNQRGK